MMYACWLKLVPTLELSIKRECPAQEAHDDVSSARAR